MPKFLSRIPSWVLWTLIALGVIVPVLHLRGPWGEFWGIDEEGWASAWATFLSAAIAATVAILILRKQSAHQASTAETNRQHTADEAEKDRKEQARIAADDRHHQAELARVERDIVATTALHAVLIEYLDAQQADIKWIRPTPATEEIRKRFERTLEHWAINCGMPPGETLDVKLMIRETATKYFFFPGEGPAILREDYRNFLREMFDDLYMTISTSPKERYKALEFRRAKYRDDIQVRDRELYGFATSSDSDD